MVWRIFYPLLRFRGSFERLAPPFLVLCAIVIPCWLLFRRYRRVTNPMSRRHELLLLTFVVYLLGLATVTLTPERGSRNHPAAAVGIELHPNLSSLTCSSANRASVSNNRGFCLDNAAGNVVLFFPFGILLALVWGRGRFWRGLLIAIALSSSIELIQYITRSWGNRSADVNDVILNSLGAGLGLVAVALLRWCQSAGVSIPRE